MTKKQQQIILNQPPLKKNLQDVSYLQKDKKKNTPNASRL
jgi:hypothetical protein